jgi:hypothetical protein
MSKKYAIFLYPNCPQELVVVFEDAILDYQGARYLIATRLEVGPHFVEAEIRDRTPSSNPMKVMLPIQAILCIVDIVNDNKLPPGFLQP